MIRYTSYNDAKGDEESVGDQSVSYDSLLPPLGITDRPKGSKRRFVYRRIGLLLFIFVCLLFFSFAFRTKQFPIKGLEHLVARKEIPNHVHFVRLVDRSSDGSPQPLTFHLASFIAIYSAHLHLKPDKIFVWTDAAASSLVDLDKSVNPYVRAIANIPTVRLQHYDSIDHTSRGVPVIKYAHKSDFIRAEVMAKYGGIYFDDDAWVLRDLSFLRKAGFDNVFGRQSNGQLCQAMWMSRPSNNFMKAWVDLQDREFTGDWTKAGNDLITQLHLDFVRNNSTNHALVLEQDAFFPGDWLRGSLEMMYGLHEQSYVTTGKHDDAIRDGLSNLKARVKGDQSESSKSTKADKLSNVDIYRIMSDFSTDKPVTWIRDWGSSYVIHGWFTGIKNTKSHDLFGEFKTFSPEYILSRKSNIARALYPALKHALTNGALVLPKLRSMSDYIEERE